MHKHQHGVVYMLIPALPQSEGLMQLFGLRPLDYLTHSNHCEGSF